MTNTIQQKSALALSILCMVMAAGFTVYLSCMRFAYGEVNVDAGDYLVAADFLLDGIVPIRDFPSGYAPASSLFFAAGFWVLGKSYSAALMVMYIFHLLNTGLLFYISRRLGANVFFSLVACLLYLVSLFVLMEGWTIALEPFQMVFVLLALAVYFSCPDKVKALVIGLLLGCSVMMKQYSLLFILAFLLEFILQKSDGPNRAKKLTNIVVFCFGTSAAFLLFCAVTLCNPVRTFISLATYGGTLTSYGTTSAGKTFWLLRRLIGILPLTVVLFASGTAYALVRRPPHCRILILLIVAGCIPLAIRHYPHYLQLSVPFVLALSALAVTRLYNQFKAKHLLPVVLASAAVSALLLRPTVGYGLYRVREDRRLGLRREVEVTARIIAQHLPPKTEVLFIGGHQYRFHSGLRHTRLVAQSALVYTKRPDLDLSSLKHAIVFLEECNGPEVENWLTSAGLMEKEVIVKKNIVLYSRPKVRNLPRAIAK